MATKLHDTYGFSYNTLKVLLGGWNTWNQEHATDPAKYPEGGASATPGSGSAPAPAGATVAAPQP